MTDNGDAEVLTSAVVRWIESVLPGVRPVFEPVVGGFGAGVRGRVGDAGVCAFLKATPAEDAADDRVEALVLHALPLEAGAPALLGTTEIDGWTLTLTEFIDGTPPDEPWADVRLAQALAHVSAMHDTLARLVPPSLPTVAQRMQGRATYWTRTAAGAPLPLTAWERRHLDRLADGEAAFPPLAHERHVLHFDLRHDNFLFEGHNVRVLDWGRACLGPAWIDIVCLLLESDVHAPSLEKVFADATAHVAPDPAQVDAFLAVLASYWRDASRPDAPAHPGLRERRLRSLAATESWLAERWG